LSFYILTINIDTCIINRIVVYKCHYDLSYDSLFCKHFKKEKKRKVYVIDVQK